MKAAYIFLFCSTFILSGCIVFPDVDVAQPLIRGTVFDESGSPVKGAEVVLLPMFFTRTDNEQTALERTVTDEKGEFLFRKKTRVDWVHNYHFLARAKCKARIEVRAEGFLTQEIDFINQGKHYTQDICKGVQFEANVQIVRQT